MEATPHDVTFVDGHYRVAGTDLSVSLQSLIDKNQGQAEHPLDTSLGIDHRDAFPSGAHVAEVEIDPGHRRGRAS